MIIGISRKTEMSRSYAKTPISGISTAVSEKEDKTMANRKERRLIRRILGCSPKDVILPQRREVSDVCVMSKDGKHWFDAKKYPKLMRK